MYNLAGKWHVVPAGTLNPAAGIERFHEERRRRFVTAEEMPRLAKAIDSESNPFIRNALWLLLLTGLRRNELLKSQWADIDWKQRTRKLVMLTRMVGAGYKNRHATWCFGCRSRQGVSSIRHSNSPPGILGQDQGGI
jgi:integrase